MDKVESLGWGFSYKRPEKKRASSKTQKSYHPFAAILKSAETEGESAFEEHAFQSEDLEELLDNVHQMGERLGESPTMENIKGYRLAVTAFLALVVSSMLGIQEKTSGANLLKRKKYTLVQIINQTLDILVRRVLEGQEEQMAVLARVEEINGLIVNLLT